MITARRYLFPAAIGLFIVLACVETGLQIKDSEYTRSVTTEVIRQARASTPKEKVLAIRDYLRRHIRFQEALHEGRPFFRATASETLQDGIGYCGEVSRTFICMANAAGISAQRLNLIGTQSHVVAEAHLGAEGLVVVDCQNPPTISELESLDKVMQRSQYTDYSTLNLRRLGLGSVLSRVKLRMGGFATYLSERPHALKAALWIILAVGFLLVKALRRLVRRFLLWRGWVHGSDKPRIARISADLSSAPDKESALFRTTKAG